MSELSNAAFATKALLNNHPTPPKRSQLFELYAAYLGFNSYAALQAANINLALQQLQQQDPKHAKRRLQKRLSELALPESLLVPLASSIAQQLAILASNAPEVVCNKAALHLGLSHQLAGQPADKANDLLLQLKRLATAGNPQARLLFVLWQLAEAEDSGSDETEEVSRGSEYWYKQRLAGAVLSADAQRWADAFEQSLRREQPHSLLRQTFPLSSLALPNIRAVLSGREDADYCCSLAGEWIVWSLLECYGSGKHSDDSDDEFYDLADEFGELTPWLMLSYLQQPSYEHLYQLFEMLDDPVECYAIYLFGLANDIDLTLSNHWLVNMDTGGDWDEHGPAGIAGYAGLDLPRLSDEDKVKAEVIAERVIRLTGERKLGRKIKLSD